MSDSRTRMAERFREILNETFAKVPESMFVNVPVGRLVEAAHEMFDGLPRVPVYDPEVTPMRVFSGVLTADDATAGRDHDRVTVVPSETGYGVVLGVFDGHTGRDGEARLPREDARQLFLTGLSVVDYQDEQERREAKGE